MAAIKAGKDICLANKETLIAGGPFVLPLAAQHNVHILPADSEHSAIFQVMQGLPEGGLRRIILTASGGAFRDWPVEKLSEVGTGDWRGGAGWVAALEQHARSAAQHAQEPPLLQSCCVSCCCSQRH